MSSVRPAFAGRAANIRRLGRRGAETAARRLGREEQLAELRLALGPPEERRNRQDDLGAAVLMASVLRRDSHCIDIGAHEGALLQHMLRLAPAGRFLAIEPLPSFSAALRTQFPSVNVRELALGNRTGKAQFMVRPAAAISSLEWVPPGENPETWRGPIRDEATRIEVDVARLDDILPDGFAPSFIKIDVEGGEYEVLEGALETLRRHKPVVALEHSLGATREPGAVHDLLTEQAGLRIFDIDGGGPYNRAALHEEASSLRHWFYFAREWD